MKKGLLLYQFLTKVEKAWKKFKGCDDVQDAVFPYYI